MKDRDVVKMISVGMIFLFIFGILGLVYLFQTEYEANLIAPGFERAFHKFLCCLLLAIILLVIIFYFTSREKCIYLSRENRKYAEMVKASADLVFYCSSKTQQVHWYGRGGQIETLEEENTHFVQISHPEDVPVILQQLEDSKRGKVYDIQTRIMDDSGCYETFNCRMVPVKNAEGSFGSVVGFIKKLNTAENH